MTAAARLLGVHANTVRAWTDQGRLRCLRINERGDRRYSPRDLQLFLARAGRAAPASLPAVAGSTWESAGPAPAVARATRSASDAIAAGTAPATEGPNPGVLRRIAGLSVGDQPPDLLAAAAEVLAEAGYSEITLALSNGERRVLAGRPVDEPALARRAIRACQPVAARGARTGVRSFALPLDQHPAADVLLLRRPDDGLALEQELDYLAALGAQLAAARAGRRRAEQLEQERRRFEILQTISSEISPQLDLERILRRLLEYASDLFVADHAGVLRRLPTGTFVVDQALNLSSEFRQALEHAPTLPLTQYAFEEGRIVTAVNYPEDPRGTHLRRAMLREGIDTLTAAPLVSDGELLGALVLYHDQPHDWLPGDLALLEQLAKVGAMALNNARNYERMATWAAQLQSIQQLGARLTRLNSVHEIGQAIAAELNQLIDYHNVRVYRIEGDEVVPVAWRGEVGVYDGEDGTQLRVQMGQGITGWVARFGVAQYLPDAAADRRTETIPGTEDDMDESLLLAPMLYEDEVIGVIVLAKLGLHQFTGDDLRLLEIYASIAAQAIANADVTEQLRAQSEALARQLQSQRELLRMTESILSTLDAQQLLDEIAVRLGTLLHMDNVAVHLYEAAAGLVRPIFARGSQADVYMANPYRADEGVSAYVLRSGEAELVQDMLSDPRIVHFDAIGPEPGAVIIAPLRSRGRVSGLISIHRSGPEARFSAEEFELVKLFAGHASVALTNAETHRAVELRAETDPLTGLKNHGTFVDQLNELTADGQPFALLMIDLDGFKGYNDARGHEAGNVMLKKLAGVLRVSCRDSDEVFRYGGDEFAIILPHTAQSGAVHVAHKVRKAVRAANSARGRARIACSIGVAIAPADGRDRSSIVLAADRACYAAKRSGGDTVKTAAQGLELGEEFSRRVAAQDHEPAGSLSTA